MGKTKIPYLQWRDGRPRWEPGPALRARGYKGRDLKDASGLWLSRGAAIDAADAINATIADGQAPAPAALRTVAALFEALRQSPKFIAAKDSDRGTRGRRLAARTRKDYLRHLAAIERVLGDVALVALTPAAIEAFHEEVCEASGVAMANAILRTFKLALYYGVNKLRWLASNPAAGVEMPELEGRLVMWTPEESESFVAAADWCGRESVGDAHLLALCTAANRGDVISWPELALENGVYRIRRRKTGRDCFIPSTEQLRARLAIMRARKRARWPNVAFSHELVDTDTGAPYRAEGSKLTHEHEAVRALAGGLIFALEDIGRFLFGLAPAAARTVPFTPLPSLLGKRFQDLRDTAITNMVEAKLDIPTIANITGHSLSTVHAIVDKHYFVRNAKLSRNAAAALDAHRRKSS